MTWSSHTYQGKTVVLRAPKASDVEDYLIKAGQPETTLAYGGDPEQITVPTVESYLAGLEKFPDSEKWVIEVSDHAIGRIRIDDIDRTEGHCRIALGLWHPDDWDHGYGSDSIRLVIGHAFHQLKLHRVDLVVLESNRRAIRAYGKAGFKLEGVLRERALIRGTRENDLIMSILKHEFVD